MTLILVIYNEIRKNYHPKFGILLLSNSGGGISPDKHKVKLMNKLKELENELKNGELFRVDLAKTNPQLQLVRQMNQNNKN